MSSVPRGPPPRGPPPRAIPGPPARGPPMSPPRGPPGPPPRGMGPPPSGPPSGPPVGPPSGPPPRSLPNAGPIAPRGPPPSRGPPGPPPPPITPRGPPGPPPQMSPRSLPGPPPRLPPDLSSNNSSSSSTPQPPPSPMNINLTNPPPPRAAGPPPRIAPPPPRAAPPPSSSSITPGGLAPPSSITPPPPRMGITPPPPRAGPPPPPIQSPTNNNNNNSNNLPPSARGPPPSRGPPPISGPPPSRGPPPISGPPPSRGPPPISGPPPSRGPPPISGPPPSRGPPPISGPPPSRGPPPGLKGPPTISSPSPPPPRGPSLVGLQVTPDGRTNTSARGGGGILPPRGLPPRGPPPGAPTPSVNIPPNATNGMPRGPLPLPRGLPPRGPMSTGPTGLGEPSKAAPPLPFGNNINGNGMLEGERDPNGKFTVREIQEAFQAFDLDNNNYIGSAEIRHVLINIGEQASDDEIDEMIRMVDKDGDNLVSFEEFYAMVTGGQSPPAGIMGGITIGMSNKVSGGQDDSNKMIEIRQNRRVALQEFSEDNKLKPESIKKIYKRYQSFDKNNNNGLINYNEFCDIFQIEGSAIIEKLFSMFDKEKSGEIDIKEFLISLNNFSGGSKDERLRFAFLVFDEEGNGVISKVELMRILKANHMASSDAEVKRKAETIMSQADKDGDGVITFDEFVVVSKKYPNILFPSYSSIEKN